MAFDSRVFVFVICILAFWSLPTEAIKCYQNQSRIQETFQSTQVECSSIGTVRATGCLKYTNYAQNTVTRMCDYTNCTENGYNRANTCYNTTDTTTCCCMSDGCNAAPSTTSYMPMLLAIPSIIVGLYFSH